MYGRGFSAFEPSQAHCSPRARRHCKNNDVEYLTANVDS